jgi:HAD superfamily hydrolase (TIGR01549 family)
MFSSISSAKMFLIHLLLRTMPGRPEVVLFDIGNTLLFPNWLRILQPLEKRGITPTRDQIEATERKTKKEWDELVMREHRRDHGFWYNFYGHLLDLLGIPDLGLQQSLTHATAISANFDQIRPGTREILKRIGQNYRIGVISNADGKIVDVLTQCGICDCFLTITDSGVVGYEKPHPAIFQAALHAIKVVPQNALYVGDIYCVDYAGATKAGMQALLFDVSGAYRDAGFPRVESLDELSTHLGC